HRLGRVVALEPSACLPMKQSVATRPIGPRAVLLGNAAHTLHPVAAQGFNLTLRDCQGLATLLTQAKQAGRPLGDSALLARYVSLRAPDQHHVSRATHFLAHRVTEQTWPSLCMG